MFTCPKKDLKETAKIPARHLKPTLEGEKHIQGKNEVTLLQVINICAGINPGNGIKEGCNELESGKYRLNPSERSEPAVQRSGFPHKV